MGYLPSVFRIEESMHGVLKNQKVPMRNVRCSFRLPGEGCGNCCGTTGETDLLRDGRSVVNESLYLDPGPVHDFLQGTAGVSWPKLVSLSANTISGLIAST